MFLTDGPGQPGSGSRPSDGAQSAPLAADRVPAQLLASDSRAPRLGSLNGHHSSSLPGHDPSEPQCWVTDKMMRVGTISTHFSSLFLYGCYFQRFPGSSCFPSNGGLNAPGKNGCLEGEHLCFLERLSDVCMNGGLWTFPGDLSAGFFVFSCNRLIRWT